ncbi:MAG: NYN domain-containing protein [Spirochaetaceae bacterium]|jgi:uncharacterized LabA/DUF88 family protein|nr:NYN domain-containing protein [Spirochaetaceae bacterium]
MFSETNGQAKLAVLIDADNTQAAMIEGLLNEVAKYGVASIKRIYGDWTKPNLGSWKRTLLDSGIQPIQQFAYTSGKNATDAAMIIDAMDILYREKPDGFCLVSSDSDFTPLATRLREAGCMVYGFGEEKTPQAFRAACNKFTLTEILVSQTDDDDAEEEARARKKKKKDFKPDRKLIKLLRNAVDDLSGEDGWAYLAPVGQKIANQSPDFDSRNFGFRKLGDLFRAIPQFETEERTPEKGGMKQLFIRWRKKKLLGG